MITRLPGTVPTRSRAVAYRDLVFAVAVAPDKAPSVYEQTRQALARIDANLVESGTAKQNILTALVYLADMTQKPEMDRAWNEWCDPDHPPMRACLGVTLEGKDLVEIVVTAAK